MIKGFALNDERLKNNGENSYFEELLARIRDIRSSEKDYIEILNKSLSDLEKQMIINEYIKL